MMAGQNYQRFWGEPSILRKRPQWRRNTFCAVLSDAQLSERWNDVKLAEHLATDVDLARFLIQLYDDVGQNRNWLKLSHCNVCGFRLSLTCLRCLALGPRIETQGVSVAHSQTGNPAPCPPGNGAGPFPSVGSADVGRLADHSQPSNASVFTSEAEAVQRVSIASSSSQVASRHANQTENCGQLFSQPVPPLTSQTCEIRKLLQHGSSASAGGNITENAVASHSFSTRTATENVQSQLYRLILVPPCTQMSGLINPLTTILPSTGGQFGSQRVDKNLPGHDSGSSSQNTSQQHSAGAAFGTVNSDCSGVKQEGATERDMGSEIEASSHGVNAPDAGTGSPDAVVKVEPGQPREQNVIPAQTNQGNLHSDNPLGLSTPSSHQSEGCTEAERVEQPDRTDPVGFEAVHSDVLAMRRHYLGAQSDGSVDITKQAEIMNSSSQTPGDWSRDIESFSRHLAAVIADSIMTGNTSKNLTQKHKRNVKKQQQVGKPCAQGGLNDNNPVLGTLLENNPAPERVHTSTDRKADASADCTNKEVSRSHGENNVKHVDPAVHSVVAAESAVLQPSNLQQPTVFNCGECEAMFMCVDSLNLHMSHHIEERKATLTAGSQEHAKGELCSGCGVKCNGSEGLKKHKNHTVREKPYVCRVCFTAFIHACSINWHLRKHRETLGHLFCETCDMDFACKQWMQHQIDHSAGKTAVVEVESNADASDSSGSAAAHFVQHPLQMKSATDVGQNVPQGEDSDGQEKQNQVTLNHGITQSQITQSTTGESEGQACRSEQQIVAALSDENDEDDIVILIPDVEEEQSRSPHPENEDADFGGSDASPQPAKAPNLQACSVKLPRLFMCSLCKVLFPNASGLDLHNSQMHRVKEERTGAVTAVKEEPVTGNAEEVINVAGVVKEERRNSVSDSFSPPVHSTQSSGVHCGAKRVKLAVSESATTRVSHSTSELGHSSKLGPSIDEHSDTALCLSDDSVEMREDAFGDHSYSLARKRAQVGHIPVVKPCSVKLVRLCHPLINTVAKAPHLLMDSSCGQMMEERSGSFHDSSDGDSCDEGDSSLSRLTTEHKGLQQHHEHVSFLAANSSLSQDAELASTSSEGGTELKRELHSKTAGPFGRRGKLSLSRKKQFKDPREQGVESVSGVGSVGHKTDPDGQAEVALDTVVSPLHHVLPSTQLLRASGDMDLTPTSGVADAGESTEADRQTSNAFITSRARVSIKPCSVKLSRASRDTEMETASGVGDGGGSAEAETKIATSTLGTEGPVICRSEGQITSPSLPSAHVTSSKPCRVELLRASESTLAADSLSVSQDADSESADILSVSQDTDNESADVLSVSQDTDSGSSYTPSVSQDTDSSDSESVSSVDAGGGNRKAHRQHSGPSTRAAGSTLSQWSKVSHPQFPMEIVGQKLSSIVTGLRPCSVRLSRIITCGECQSAAFVEARSLNKHLSQHMSHRAAEFTPDGPDFQAEEEVCRGCGIKCDGPDALRKHRSHMLKEKVHTCNVCSTAFVRACSINWHMRKHKQTLGHLFCESCNTVVEYRNWKMHLTSHRTAETGNADDVTDSNTELSQSDELATDVAQGVQQAEGEGFEKDQELQHSHNVSDGSVSAKHTAPSDQLPDVIICDEDTAEAADTADCSVFPDTRYKEPKDATCQPLSGTMSANIPAKSRESRIRGEEGSTVSEETADSDCWTVHTDDDETATDNEMNRPSLAANASLSCGKDQTVAQHPLSERSESVSDSVHCEQQTVHTCTTSTDVTRAEIFEQEQDEESSTQKDQAGSDSFASTKSICSLSDRQAADRSGASKVCTHSVDDCRDTCIDSLPPLHKCEDCGKSLSAAHSLKRHVSTTHLHEKPCKCRMCGKRFFLPFQLKRHMPCHSAEKRFKCDICSASFGHDSTLWKHKLSHSKSKQYLGSNCGAKHESPFALRAHKDTQSTRKKYACRFCRQKFTQYHAKIRHEKCHSGKKEFTCEKCNLSFAQSHSLTLHMRRHTGLRPYKCSVCDKTFIDSYGLKVHARIHFTAK